MRITRRLTRQQSAEVAMSTYLGSVKYAVTDGQPKFITEQTGKDALAVQIE